MNPTPYLFFNGQCRAAATAYAELFGLPVPDFMTMADGPPELDIPENRKDWIMHCALEFGDGILMMSDDFEGNSDAMAGCNVSVSLPTPQKSKEVFDALAKEGDVRMAWEPTFWSAGFGTLTDKFGVRWMIDTAETEN